MLLLALFSSSAPSSCSSFSSSSSFSPSSSSAYSVARSIEIGATAAWQRRILAPHHTQHAAASQLDNEIDKD